jgi:hypothetical protein
MMVVCILASLGSEGAKALHNSQYSYVINGTRCGPLLTKVILLDCKVETASINLFVHAQLGALDQHMVSLNNNIIEFNKYMRHNMTICLSICRLYRCT